MLAAAGGNQPPPSDGGGDEKRHGHYATGRNRKGTTGKTAPGKGKAEGINEPAASEGAGWRKKAAAMEPVQGVVIKEPAASEGSGRRKKPAATAPVKGVVIMEPAASEGAGRRKKPAATAPVKGVVIKEPASSEGAGRRKKPAATVKDKGKKPAPEDEDELLAPEDEDEDDDLLAPEDEETVRSRPLTRYQLSLRRSLTWAAGCSKEEEAVAYRTRSRSLKRHRSEYNGVQEKALEQQAAEPTVPAGTVGASQVKERALIVSAANLLIQMATGRGRLGPRSRRVPRGGRGGPGGGRGGRGSAGGGRDGRGSAGGVRGGRGSAGGGRGG